MSKKDNQKQKGIVEKKISILKQTPEGIEVEADKIIWLIDRIYLVDLFEKLMKWDFIPTVSNLNDFLDKHFTVIEDK